jgi:DNA-binding CsgD family transcriptional regulator
MLSLFGRYSEALRITEQAAALAEDMSLAFAHPHVHVAKATALLGLGAFEAAAQELEIAFKVAEGMHDRHNIVDIRTVRARLSLSRRDFADALELTREPAHGVTYGMAAELLATRALALMCAGQVAEAESIFGQLTHLESLPETAGLMLAAQAVQAARLNDERTLISKLEELRDLGVADALVVGRRASIDLDASIRELDVPDLIHFVRAEGHVLHEENAAMSSLTPREVEVLRLVSRGHTNKEIAAKLVIAEVTAKVHVRNILRKLRARSRTEAAVLATKLGLEGAEAEFAVRRFDS